MHTALDIGTHFIAGQKVSHLTYFSSYSSYNSFIFLICHYRNLHDLYDNLGWL